MNHVLSDEEIWTIRTELDNFDAEGINFYAIALQSALDAFKDEAVVQSLFASGKLGTRTREQLEGFLDIIKRLRETYTGETGLVNSTRLYLDRIEKANAGN